MKRLVAVMHLPHKHTWEKTCGHTRLFDGQCTYKETLGYCQAFLPNMPIYKHQVAIKTLFDNDPCAESPSDRSTFRFPISLHRNIWQLQGLSLANIHA